MGDPELSAGVVHVAGELHEGGDDGCAAWGTYLLAAVALVGLRDVCIWLPALSTAPREWLPPALHTA